MDEHDGATLLVGWGYPSKRSPKASTENTALAAVEFSLQYQLPMGDAFLYTAARSRNAGFVTSDAHFKGLPEVTFL